MVLRGMSMDGSKGRYRLGNGTLITSKYRVEICGPTVRPYVGSVVLGFLLSPQQCWALCGESMQAVAGG